jgi:hypothetical protein
VVGHWIVHEPFILGQCQFLKDWVQCPLSWQLRLFFRQSYFAQSEGLRSIPSRGSNLSLGHQFVQTGSFRHNLLQNGYWGPILRSRNLKLTAHFHIAHRWKKLFTFKHLYIIKMQLSHTQRSLSPLSNYVLWLLIFLYISPPQLNVGFLFPQEIRKIYCISDMENVIRYLHFPNSMN